MSVIPSRGMSGGECPAACGLVATRSRKGAPCAPIGLRHTAGRESCFRRVHCGRLGAGELRSVSRRDFDK